TTAKPKPLHYGVLLLPSVTPIDVFGPVDVFTALAMTFTNQTGKLEFSVLSVNSTPATTNPPLKGLDFGFPLLPTITFDQYRQLKAHNFTADEHDKHYNKTVIKNKGPLDVLIVPGGGGARAEISKEIAFVKEIYPDLKYIISVCTGSTVLARAGVLDGKRATTNKKAWAWATSFGKNVKYQPKARWVSDGNVWTGSGVSAATDTAYAFVADIYGEDVAQYVADVSEYTRWTNASLDPFAERWGV
ncbi:DJ-1/PfpI family protein, partial [Byssothecium circinans]